MPGVSGEPVVTMLVCFIYLAREAAGALSTRLPCALYSFEGQVSCMPRAHFAPRECGVASEYEPATFSAVIARECGRSGIPETLMMETSRRGVLDAPPSRGMTVEDVHLQSRGAKCARVMHETCPSKE